MQAPDQQNTGTLDDLTKKVEQQLELSEAWRQLLGLEAQPASAPGRLEATEAVQVAGAGTSEAVPVLSHDPWHSLAHQQGIQVVDLQQAHVHTAQATDEESDVEHALDMMQEQEKKSEK